MSWTTNEEIPRSYPCFSSTAPCMTSPIFDNLPMGTQPRLLQHQGASGLPPMSVFGSITTPWPSEYRDKANDSVVNNHQESTQSPGPRIAAYTHRNRYMTFNQTDCRPDQFPVAAKGEEPAVMVQTPPRHLNFYQCWEVTNNSTPNHAMTPADDQQHLQTSTFFPLEARQDPIHSDPLHLNSEVGISSRHQALEFSKQEIKAELSHRLSRLPMANAHGDQDFMAQAQTMQEHSNVLTSNDSSPNDTPLILTPHPHNDSTILQYGNSGDYSSSKGIAYSSFTRLNTNLFKNICTPILSSQSLPAFSCDSPARVSLGGELQYNHPPTTVPGTYKQHHYKPSPLLMQSLPSAFMLSCSVSAPSRPPLSSAPTLFSSPTSSVDVRQHSSYGDSSTIRHDAAFPLSHIGTIRAGRSFAIPFSNYKKKFTGTSTSTSGIKKPKPSFVCEYPNCKRVFTRPFNLKSHELTHNDSRPFDCKICSKAFARIHDLYRHKKTHSMIKLHECIVCLQRFARQDAVTRHLKISEGVNRCGLILRHRKISVRDVAAGRVRRGSLGDEVVIGRMLEDAEELVRKARAARNMDTRSMNTSLNSLTTVNIRDLVPLQFQQPNQGYRFDVKESTPIKVE
ncbi:hypothetical protein BGZ49_005485 [Haplosporangium sp. Z 27]|nr:hypothetical protein BGZ49_005485 [Haplosporangium sp. Z 27]